MLLGRSAGETGAAKREMASSLQFTLPWLLVNLGLGIGASMAEELPQPETDQKATSSKYPGVTCQVQPQPEHCSGPDLRFDL
jgi:hypothetical protein